MKGLSGKTRHGAALLAGEGGFTLAELMVFLMIMIIFMIGIGGMISSGVNSSTASYNLVKINEAGNNAISTMTRQMRVATHVDGISSGSARLVFTGDLDGDGVDEAQDFRVENGYLMMGSEQWLEGVDSVAFSYFRYNETTKQVEPLVVGSASWNTAIVRIDMVVNLSASSVGIDVARSFSGSVALRNVLQ